MIAVANERSVAASPTAVWAALSDFGRLACWAQDIDHSCRLTERREGVGTERRVQVKSNVVLERVTVWQPNEALAYEIVGLPSVSTNGRSARTETARNLR